MVLTHRDRVKRIYVSKIIIIGSDNDLLPGRRQAIMWTNAGILLIGPSIITLSKILTEINRVSFQQMRLKMSSAKRRPSICFVIFWPIHLFMSLYIIWFFGAMHKGRIIVLILAHGHLCPACEISCNSIISAGACILSVIDSRERSYLLVGSSTVTLF